MGRAINRVYKQYIENFYPPVCYELCKNRRLVSDFMIIKSVDYYIKIYYSNETIVKLSGDCSAFFYRSNFNQDISRWDVSGVTNMRSVIINLIMISLAGMYRQLNLCIVFYNSKFNQDIGDWDVSEVKNMHQMFCNSKFNHDISRWDVSSVINMYRMFCNSKFNHDISAWDVSSVICIVCLILLNLIRISVPGMFRQSSMFKDSEFNQDISEWDISGVTDMSSMFKDSKFNHDISAWDIST